MKAFKKIVAVAVAAVTSICGLQIVSAGAFDPIPGEPEFTSYITADLTRNGTVNYNDFLVMDQFLSGTRYVGYNFHMDVDRNNVISRADENHISSYMVGILSKNYVAGLVDYFQPTYTQSYYAPSGLSTSCDYVRHTYSTPAIDDYEYTLSMTEAAFPTGTSSPDSIIGSDSRVPEYSEDMKSGICRLSCGGTGFVVGDHTIATAAHCCYSGNGNWVNNLYAQFPSSSNVSDENESGYVDFDSQKFFAKEAHISQAYYDNSSIAEDYALITVSESLSNKYHFDLGIPYDIYSSNSPFDNYNIYVTGYPVDHYGDDGCFLYTGIGNILSCASTNILHYNTDTAGGQSGSPVYIKETIGNTHYNTVVGIHTNAGNYGSIFTPIRLKFYLNNSNASY